ncbi:MAG: hypothetical protein KDJ22_10995 [Candidatus Competibacteraceae bacterium]|nr:hypothetical protein [Candidatus Competibacteraceae bacterium]MCP5124169.1 hypothetical protein [Gammaproteobacteria bacterium]
MNAYTAAISYTRKESMVNSIPYFQQTIVANTFSFETVLWPPALAANRIDQSQPYFVLGEVGIANGRATGRPGFTH